VLAPLAGLSLNVLIQAGLSWASVRLPVSMGLGFLAGLVASGAVAAYALWRSGAEAPDFAALLALDLVTSVGLGFGYLNFVNLNAASIRIRILKEIQEAGGLSREELARRYDDAQLIEDRIHRLIRERQLLERDGRYVPGVPLMLLAARTIGAMKWVVMGHSFDLTSGPR
jgi:hypothetical protein